MDQLKINEHNLITDIKYEQGGCSRLLKKKYKFSINWINHEYTKKVNEYEVKPKIIVSKNTKTTLVSRKDRAINLSKCKLNNIHVMYYDYYSIKGKKPINCMVSIDFASQNDLSIDEVMKLKDKVDIIFCSEHDHWAKKNNLKMLAENTLIVFHTPLFIEIYKGNQIIKCKNENFKPAKKQVVGIGDVFAMYFLTNLNKILNDQKINVLEIKKIQKKLSRFL